MLMMLTAEAAAAFDELTLGGRVDELTRQDEGAWPNTFRSGRFIPAVEYINASRARTRLIARMHELFEDVDVIVMPTFRGDGLRITNLTGHPCLTIPNAFDPLEDDPDSERRRPRSISLIGGLHRDADVLAVGALIQSQTDFHRMRPPVR
jgi:Asp-tRNA(Asn)/Glu-tRNA(Gln) amidotransferase A subunit family amidase